MLTLSPGGTIRARQDPYQAGQRGIVPCQRAAIRCGGPPNTKTNNEDDVPSTATMSSTGSRFEHLVSIMRALRAPDGCPWDREQTLASLRPFLLEETYEVIDAIDRADMAGLQEELGDLLFEIVFLAQIAEEAGAFAVGDAAEAAAAKLVRRHPHVFGTGDRAQSAEEALGRWEEMKREEKGDGQRRKTALGGVPRTLPSLLRAYEYGSRAASLGFDWQRPGDVVEKIEEEIAEVRQALDAGGNQSTDALEEEVGDLLFAIANLSRKLGVEPENALRRANDKFERRFTTMETRFAERGETMKSAGLEALEAEWQRIKADRRAGRTAKDNGS
jgi:MazG family protein